MNNTTYNDIILEEYLYGNENDSIILDESFKAIEKAKNGVKRLVTKFKTMIKMVITSAKNDKKIRADLIESIVLLIIPIIMEIAYRKKYENELFIAKLMKDGLITKDTFSTMDPEASKAIASGITEAFIVMIIKLCAQYALSYCAGKKLRASFDKIFNKEKEVSKIIASGISKEKNPVKKTVREKIKKIWEAICAKINSIFKKNEAKQSKQESVDYVFDMESTNLLNSIK